VTIITPAVSKVAAEVINSIHNEILADGDDATYTVSWHKLNWSFETYPKAAVVTQQVLCTLSDLCSCRTEVGGGRGARARPWYRWYLCKLV